MTKELKNIQKAIKKYIEKHNGNVHFIGSFMAFKGKECDIIDDIVLAYGFKDTLKIDLKTQLKMIKKEKEEFVNW